MYLKIFFKQFYFGKVELFQYFLGQIMEFGVKKYSSFMNEFHWNLVKLKIFFFERLVY